MSKTPLEIEKEITGADTVVKSQRVVFAMAIILLACTIVINLLVGYTLSSRFPVRELIYTQNAAAVCSFAPVGERGIVSDASVKNFAAQVSIELNRIDFANWRADLNSVLEASFTPQGRRSFIAAFRDSGILNSILTERYAVTAIVRGDDAVEITSQGVEQGAYTWHVRVPITVGYAKGNEYRPENRDLDVIVIRVPVSAGSLMGIRVAGVVSTQTLNRPGSSAFSEIGG